MKTSYYLFVALFLTAAVSGCKKDSPASSEQPVISDSPQTATQTYTSTSGGTFSTQSGYGLTVIGGAVPRNASNQPGSIAFSIETKVTPPKPIPAGAILKGDVVKFGPDGFDFQWPVEATLKFPANTDPTALNILYYNPSSEKWVAVAGSGANMTDRLMTVSRLSLGYYALAELSPMGKGTTGSAWGGFEFQNPEPNKWYTLTPESVWDWVYPWQRQWFEAEALANTGHTGTGIAGPAWTTKILLPQASFRIWVSVTDGSGVFKTYSLPMTGRIEREVTFGTPQPLGSGWTPIGPLPSGGTWIAGLPTGNTAGLPALWPRPMVTFGTGAFQATLTWVNNSSHATDLDLHLYGPNNMHVYYGAKVSADSSFRLDRDWLRTSGNATENIYSTRSSLPSGAYRVTVKHYSGDPTSYSVRILRGGSVRSYSGSASSYAENEISAFSLP